MVAGEFAIIVEFGHHHCSYMAKAGFLIASSYFSVTGLTYWMATIVVTQEES